MRVPKGMWHTIWLCVFALLPQTVLSESAQRTVPGGVYVWALPEGASEPRFDGKPVLSVSGHVVVGVPISQKAGSTHLTYNLNGEERRHPFEVHSKTYTEQRLTIKNQALVTPPEETLTRIRQESARQRGLYNDHQAAFDANEGFVKPLEGVTTSLFGHRRFFNDKPRSPHSGLDIAAPIGTPIIAAGSGTVTLADDLYFNGNTIFINHGQGLVTMYCHMSELSVAEGDRVAQGDVIGLVGATGRVTGPHLHWSVSLNGNRVDPPTFMRTLNTLLREGP